MAKNAVVMSLQQSPNKGMENSNELKISHLDNKVLRAARDISFLLLVN